MVSKRTPKNPQKYFLSVLEYLRILEINKLPGSVPWWAQDTRARQACLARPGGLCPPGTPSGLRFLPLTCPPR